MTTLCPSVLKKNQDYVDNGVDCYTDGAGERYWCDRCLGREEGARLQAEWERERVKKAIESMAIYGREDCINRKELLKELGIEQEEKK